MPEFGASWQRKIRTVAVRLDLDRDGRVTRKDFEAVADRYEQTSRVSTAKAHRMRASILTVGI